MPFPHTAILALPNPTKFCKILSALLRRSKKSFRLRHDWIISTQEKVFFFSSEKIMIFLPFFSCTNRYRNWGSDVTKKFCDEECRKLFCNKKKIFFFFIVAHETIGRWSESVCRNDVSRCVGGTMATRSLGTRANRNVDVSCTEFSIRAYPAEPETKVSHPRTVNTRSNKNFSMKNIFGRWKLFFDRLNGKKLL